MGRDDDRPVPGLSGGGAPASAARAVLERAVRDGLIGADGLAPGDAPRIAWPPGSEPVTAGPDPLFAVDDPGYDPWADPGPGEGAVVAGDDELSRAISAAIGADW